MLLVSRNMLLQAKSCCLLRVACCAGANASLALSLATSGGAAVPKVACMASAGESYTQVSYSLLIYQQ